MATVGGWSLGSVAGSQTLIASASPTVSVTFTAQATPASVNRLEKHAGDAQKALLGTGVATPPAVKVVDVYGNGVPGVPVTFSVSAGGGSVTGANAVSNAAGIAAVGSWTLGTAVGMQTLRASAPTTSASDVDFTATSGTGKAIAIIPHPDNPRAALLRTEVTLRVIVVDDIGRPKAGVQVTFVPMRSHYGQGVACGGQSVTNTQGIAWVCYQLANHLWAVNGVEVSSAGLPSITVGITGFTGPPWEIRVTLQAQSLTAGEEIGRPEFSVLDAYGNGIANYPVRFVVTSGGGSLDGAVEQQDYTGPMYAPTGATGPMWRSGPVAGVNTIVISAGNLPSVTISRTTVPPP
jgi:adhesin/invasin